MFKLYLSKLHQRRKQLPLLGLTLVLALVLAACGAETPQLDAPGAEAPVVDTPAEEAPAAEPAVESDAPADLSAREAPMLADQVAAGDLPPLDDRLPTTPYVVTPLEQPGIYGGIWDTATTGQADTNGFFSYSHEPWVMFDETCSEWMPNLAEEVTVSEDGTVFTFTIREGHKWSDGEPFTTEDIMFWYEAIATHPEISVIAPSTILMSGDEMGVIEAVDDYTFSITFAEPAGLFLANLAFVFGGNFGDSPAHYLRQFHADYADPDELDALVEAEGVESWVQLFAAKAGIAQGTGPATTYDMPTLRAWQLRQSGPPWLFDRNPYYYKVDTEDRQLPYIDTIRAQAVEDGQMIALRAVAGELSHQSRGISFNDLPLFLQNQDQGDYRVLIADAEHPVGLTIFPNQNYQGDDEFLGELIRDIRFRQALNLAIDRDEINELAYLGDNLPIQEAFPRQADEPELFAHLEYDPEAAIALLDEIGLEVDSNGYRLRPNGQPLVLPIEVFAGQIYMDPTELVASYWEAIGIQTSLEEISYDLWWPRIYSFQYAFVAYVKDSHAGLTRYNYLRSYSPVSNSTYWGPSWGTWYQTGGNEGEAPPEGHPARIAQELFDEAKVTVDTDRQLEILAEIERMNLENVWEILTVGPGATVRIVKNNFHNVPLENLCQLHDSDMWAEQYYID